MRKIERGTSRPGSSTKYHSPAVNQDIYFSSFTGAMDSTKDENGAID